MSISTLTHFVQFSGRCQNVISYNFERKLRRLVDYKFAALEIFQGMINRIYPHVHFTHIYRNTPIM